MQSAVNETFGCPCGAARFTVQTRPLLRFICHCQICQSVYKAPFADVTAFRAGGVSLAAPESVTFKRLRPPPTVDRGLCNACGSPVLGFLRIAPRLKLAFVPTRNLAGLPGIPEPLLHVFYHRRVADVADSVTKVSGFWASEFAVTKALFGSLLRGG